MLIGDVWGEQDALLEKPFIGSSGQELTRMLADAGIERRLCFATNVLNLRPANGDQKLLQVTTAQLKELGGGDPSLPALLKGKWLHPMYYGELERLGEEIQTVKPHLIIALGAMALWATMRVTGINATRGTVAQGQGPARGIKVLPTYHPSAIMRQWEQRVIMVADLMKAAKEADFAEIRRPRRTIRIDPTIEQVEDFANGHYHELSVDVETARKQITEISFSPDKTFSMVIPFVDWKRPGYNYWADPADEVRAWLAVRKLMAQPCPKVFQNGLYDLQYIWRSGIHCVNVREDTMLLHHGIFPELQKGLGFLGSIYTNEASWKLLRKFKADTEKREE